MVLDDASSAVGVLDAIGGLVILCDEPGDAASARVVVPAWVAEAVRNEMVA